MTYHIAINAIKLKKKKWGKYDQEGHTNWSLGNASLRRWHLSWELSDAYTQRQAWGRIEQVEVQAENTHTKAKKE